MLIARDDPFGDGVGRYPSIGAVTARLCGPRRAGLPAFASVPSARTAGVSPGYFSAAYLGKAHDPYMTGSEPNDANFRVQNLDLGEGLTIDRLHDRRALQAHFDHVRRAIDTTGTAEAMDQFDRQAYELVTSQAARRAFDISAEESRVRDQYGRHTWGQSALLARRLVEAGCTFVTCHFGGWDHHAGIRKGMEDFLPRLDAAVSALFTDLDQRGLLEKVLVVVCGEFGYIATAAPPATQPLYPIPFSPRRCGYTAPAAKPGGPAPAAGPPEEQATDDPECAPEFVCHRNTRGR